MFSKIGYYVETLLLALFFISVYVNVLIQFLYKYNKVLQMNSSRMRINGRSEYTELEFKRLKIFIFSMIIIIVVKIIFFTAVNIILWNNNSGNTSNTIVIIF